MIAPANKIHFREPRRTVNRWGDRRRIWWTADKRGLVVESRGICGVAMPRHYHAIVKTETGERLVSRHKKLRPAQAAVAKALGQENQKQRKQK